ncbi:Protein of unknown function [Arboricoccus pini]|uniref:DUF1153 domain-containing protein n=1 Tax=Arboricoccus pini TaxID=1963835 RepID=A0A212RBJ9_9PROT|nr:DUF1153 domain-containing protein [Arboricoccus pini]SNB69590.1 Protein of unknown function [Arboricoccus pini]
MNEEMVAPDEIRLAQDPMTASVDMAALAHLPAPDTRRWVASRKSKVVGAVKEGLLTLEEACQRYQLTAEEFASWVRLIEQHGPSGLKVTHLKSFRLTARR